LPGAAQRALADASGHQASLVSYSPQQEMSAWWERAMNTVVYWRLAQHYSFDRINDPARPEAAANGQFLLISRPAYERIGGHASVCANVLEDVAIARRAKAAGFRIYFASGRGIVSTRMYRSFAAMWEGWTKNLYLLFAGSWLWCFAE